MPRNHSHRSPRTRGAAVPALYLEETLNAAVGWLRIVVGYGVAWAGVLTRNEYWRRRGTRTRLVGTVQRQLGVPAAAIERLVAGAPLRHAER
jgi:hypothetical protein